MSGKERVHLIASGDSLGLTKTLWACGEPKDGEQGYFGEDDTIKKVNCNECMKSELYREIAAEMGFEHPFTTRSKKAHATMKARKEFQAEMGAKIDRIGRIVDSFKRGNMTVDDCYDKILGVVE